MLFPILNSEEESTGQSTEPLQNKNESAGEPGDTKGFSSTSRRHPNPRCSPGRAAKEGGQRGSRPRMTHVSGALDSGGCQGLLPQPPRCARLEWCLPFEPTWLRNRKVLGKAAPCNRRREKEDRVLVRLEKGAPLGADTCFSEVFGANRLPHSKRFPRL